MRSAVADRMAWPVSREEILLAGLLCPSSWDPLIQAGLRSAVLRCPRRCGKASDRECSSTGHWRAAGPSEAVVDNRPAPDSATSEGEAWRSISDVWECSRCGSTTRNPRIGQIAGMADCTWRGKGRLSGGAWNAVEDDLIEVCDLHRQNGYGRGPQEQDPNHPRRATRRGPRTIPAPWRNAQVGCSPA